MFGLLSTYPSIGFVILSHANPTQLVRLIHRLNSMYDSPHIVVHHDEYQYAINRNDFPTNVAFVDPIIRTGWAKFSIVSAELEALSLLYRDDGPDWFFLLSASDYPVRLAHEVRVELAQAECDAFMDIWSFDDSHRGSAKYVGNKNPNMTHFGSSNNRRMKWRFYFSIQLWIPILRFVPRLRVGRWTYRPRIEARNHPFSKKFYAFYGDHWFNANRRAARIILDGTSEATALQRYFADRTQTDEGYFQIILANRSELTINCDNKRFAEWNGGGAHPVLLTEAHVNEAFASGAFFARKFAPGSPALDVIDARLDEALAEAARIRSISLLDLARNGTAGAARTSAGERSPQPQRPRKAAGR